MMGAVYQEVKKIPVLPLGGSTRQKRQKSGRSRSSSVGWPKAWAWMWRGSIHSWSRLTVSPLPAPSTPEMRMTRGKFLPLRRSYCASSSASRRTGSSLAYVSLSMAWPSSADSNMARM